MPQNREDNRRFTQTLVQKSCRATTWWNFLQAMFTNAGFAEVTFQAPPVLRHLRSKIIPVHRGKNSHCIVHLPGSADLGGAAIQGIPRTIQRFSTVQKGFSR